MAIFDDTAPPRKNPSTILQIALLAGLTVVALGIGWGSGMLLIAPQKPAEASQNAADAVMELSTAESHEALGIAYLEPITTNLAAPVGMWVRIELGLIFDGPPDAMTAQRIQEDILAYMRTVKIHQVEGASGFQHLRSDLEERARLRSEGKVTGILIKTLLFE